jgi:glycogen operon protein
VHGLRERQKRNFLATLALSQGVPMYLGGDEMGRTQHGNNNAYCQDNEISWLDWSLRDENLALLGWTRRLMDFRARHPAFRRRNWFQGRAIYGDEITDVGWFDPAGEPMTAEQWNEGFAKSVALYLNGDELGMRGPQGQQVTDDSFLLLFNASEVSIPFTVPTGHFGNEWASALDTNDPSHEEGSVVTKAGGEIQLAPRSLVVLRRVA